MFTLARKSKLSMSQAVGAGPLASRLQSSLLFEILTRTDKFSFWLELTPKVPSLREN